MPRTRFRTVTSPISTRTTCTSAFRHPRADRGDVKHSTVTGRIAYRRFDRMDWEFTGTRYVMVELA